MSKPLIQFKKASELLPGDRIIADQLIGAVLGKMVVGVDRFEEDADRNYSFGHAGRLYLNGMNGVRYTAEWTRFIVMGTTEESESDIIYRLVSHNDVLYVQWGIIQGTTYAGNRIIATRGLGDRRMPECLEGMNPARFFQFNQVDRDDFILYTTGEWLDRSIEFFRRRYRRCTGRDIKDVFHAR